MAKSIVPRLPLIFSRSAACRRRDRRRRGSAAPDREQRPAARASVGTRRRAPHGSRRNAGRRRAGSRRSSPGGRPRGSGMRTGAARTRGSTFGSPRTMRLLNSSKSAMPISGQASAAVYSCSSRRRWRLERVERRAVHQAGVMDGHRARRPHQRHGLGEVEVAGLGIHGAAEAAVGVMVVGRAVMRARQHHQRSVVRGRNRRDRCRSPARRRWCGDRRPSPGAIRPASRSPPTSC